MQTEAKEPHSSNLTPSTRPAVRGYLPTLDGWRAIAIVSVILYHDRSHRGLGWFFQNGHNGVELFFAISGVLICWRLIEEEETFGRISLRGFYVRRAFRILPPAMLFLGVLGVLALCGLITVGLREWLSAVFFVRNYSFLVGTTRGMPYFTSHVWSLSVEEHFYLILPSLLVIAGKGWRVPVLAVLSAIVIGHRFLVLQTRPWEHVLFHTDIRLDALLIPAMFAVVLLQSPRLRANFTKWSRFWPLVMMALIGMMTVEITPFWLSTSCSALMPIVVLGSVLNPSGAIARCLEFAPLRYVGRISYSLYLWQQMFFVGHFYGLYPLGWLQSTPLRFCALALVAMASYHILERPMMGLGRRLAPPATEGRP